MKPQSIALRALQSRLLRVAFFGGLGVVLQTVVFEALGPIGQLLRPSLATLVGAECGVILNFLLNNRYSFNDRSHASLAVRLVRFHLVVSGSLFLQWLFVFVAEQWGGGFWLIHGAYVAGIVLGFVSNYTWYTLWVWRHHPTQA